jgi:hypothetical protein
MTPAPEMDASQPNGLRVGWGAWSLAATGWSTVLALGVLAIVASNLIAGYLFERSNTKEHATRSAEHFHLRIAQDRTSCILTMTVEERVVFRNRYQIGAFEQMCPWMGK